MITVSWLKPQPPNIEQWRARVKKVFIMEKITAKLWLNIDTFIRRWSPLIQAMSPLFILIPLFFFLVFWGVYCFIYLQL